MATGSGREFIWENFTKRIMRMGYKRIDLVVWVALQFFVLFGVLVLPYAVLSAQSNQDKEEQAIASVFLDRTLNQANQNSVDSEIREFFLESTVDWSNKRIDIEISVPVHRLELQTRYRVSSVIESNFSVWLYDAVKDLQVNSWQNLENFWGSESFKNPYAFLKGVLNKRYAVFHQSLKHFRSLYEINIYPDLVQVWIDEQFKRKELMPMVLNKDAAKFTGLIVYVENDLPVRGESYIHTRLKNAIFPRIYNEDLDLVMSYQNVDKNILLSRGMLSYDSESNAEKYQELVGSFPLRIIARELFGKDFTDFIISNSDANSILENASMRKALRQGRVLVLYDSVPRNVLHVEKND